MLKYATNWFWSCEKKFGLKNILDSVKTSVPPLLPRISGEKKIQYLIEIRCFYIDFWSQQWFQNGLHQIKRNIINDVFIECNILGNFFFWKYVPDIIPITVRFYYYYHGWRLIDSRFIYSLKRLRARSISLFSPTKMVSSKQLTK